MTKTLILMRHAEAGSIPGQRDFDRHLTPQGQEMARFMAGQLLRKGMAPDRILCSPALRTRQTCELLLDNWQGITAPDVHYEDGLYGATPEYATGLIKKQEAAERLMVLGHNPWVHMLALSFCVPAELKKKAEIRHTYPPASCAIIEFDDTIQKGDGMLLDFFYPASGSIDG